MHRKGSCSRCGACCKGVVVNLGFDKKHPEATMRIGSYCEWLDFHGVVYKKSDDSVEIVCGERCEHLKYKDGKASCDIYEKRPLVCQEFPRGMNNICSGFTFELPKPGESVKELEIPAELTFERDMTSPKACKEVADSLNVGFGRKDFDVCVCKKNPKKVHINVGTKAVCEC